MEYQGKNENSGFTLIELIVVIVIMSIMLVFAAPQFSGFIFPDDTNKIVRWIIVKTKLLRNKAVQDQKNYIVNADIDNNRLWVTDESMVTEEELKKASEASFNLSENVNLLDVEFPGRGRLMQGTAEIVFYKKGYSDQAIIHIAGSDDQKISLFLKAFLPSVTVVEDYAESY